MIETDMNQMKLRMLIKFDKIKYLEDFYNYRSQTQINLDMDIEQPEMIKFSEKVYLSYCSKIQKQEKRRNWALNAILSIFKVLVKKRKQTQQNILRYNFYIWKIQGLKKESELDMRQRSITLENGSDFNEQTTNFKFWNIYKIKDFSNFSSK